MCHTVADLRPHPLPEPDIINPWAITHLVLSYCLWLEHDVLAHTHSKNTDSSLSSPEKSKAAVSAMA